MRGDGLGQLGGGAVPGDEPQAAALVDQEDRDRGQAEDRLLRRQVVGHAVGPGDGALRVRIEREGQLQLSDRRGVPGRRLRGDGEDVDLGLEPRKGRGEGAQHGLPGRIRRAWQEEQHRALAAQGLGEEAAAAPVVEQSDVGRPVAGLGWRTLRDAVLKGLDSSSPPSRPPGRRHGAKASRRRQQSCGAPGLCHSYPVAMETAV